MCIMLEAHRKLFIISSFASYVRDKVCQWSYKAFQ